MYQRRPMQRDDLERILPIEQAAHVSPWTRAVFEDCFKPAYRNWVLEDATGRILGYLVLLQVVDEVHVMNVCIDPDLQGQGLGRHLLQLAIAEAASERVYQILLEVRRSNRAARGLYAKLGFTVIGRRPNYYDGPRGREEAVVMALQPGQAPGRLSEA